MHGWGQWYALAAAVLTAACYLRGRRGRTAAVVALLSAAEVAATAAVALRHDPASWLVDQGVIVVAGAAAMAGAYRRLRQDLTLRGWSHAREARLRERTRVAAEIHDSLGHDLTLLSLRAAAIQVKAEDPAIRGEAAALRAGAARAIATVRGLVDLLAVDHSSDAAEVVRRAREAGMTIEVTGAPPPSGFTGRLVTEALSNAARHAPGEPVRIAFTPGHVEISNRRPGNGVEDGGGLVRHPDFSNRGPDDEGTQEISDRRSDDERMQGVGGLAQDLGSGIPQQLESRTGTGLAALRDRLTNAGGSLTVHTTDDQFRIAARIPDGIDDEPEHDFASRRRRLRTTLAAGVLAPLVSLGVVSAAFYTWAAHDTTMEPVTYQRLQVGMAERDALALLPRRQAPIRRGDADCRHYTDGNFPLAYGNYEICFRAGRIESLHDSTGGPA